VLHEETSHPELDAVALVRRDAALPEGTRHDTEHRAAVELLTASLDGVDTPSADRPAFDER
jgi:hypothetical protein